MARAGHLCHLSAAFSSSRNGVHRMSEVLSLLALVAVAVVWSRGGRG
jgi:hypothetical protein